MEVNKPDASFYEPYQEERPADARSVELSYRELTSEDEDLAELMAAGLEEMDTSTEDGRKGTIENLRRFLENPNHIYLVGFVDGKVAGRIFGFVNDHPRGTRSIFIDEVDTLEKYRRRGVAKGMMEDMKKIAHNLDAEEMWLGTEDDNKSAIALYRSLNPYEDYADRLFSYQTGTK